MRKINYLFLAAFLLFCSNAFTQSTTIFIKALDNNGVLLNGGSTATGHANQIEAFSYSHGVSSPCVMGGCNPSLSDFAFMMSLNPATVTARQMLLKGLHLMSVDVVYHKSAASFDYYKIHMEDVAITSVQEPGSSEIPTISVTLTPAKIAWLYTAQKADGSAGVKTKGGWDAVLNIEWNYF